MTASPLVIGTHVPSIGRDPAACGPALGRSGDVAHAVARPVVDGLDSAVCGQLVTVSAAEDWITAQTAARCAECTRIAG
jgi:hypothetical protein